MITDLRAAGLTALPGAERIQQGLLDLAAGRETVDALLVSIGASRLRRNGLDVSEPFSSPEDRLYRLLSRQHGNGAHSRYNALVRQLVSFERTLASATK